MTNFAWNINIRQEIHLNRDGSISRAVLAAPTFYVKGEATLLVATDFGFASFSKEGTDFVEDTCVGSWIRARGSTNRRLINMYNFIEMINSGNCAMATRNDTRAIEFIRQH